MPRELVVSDEKTLRIEERANSPEFCTSSEFSNAVSFVYGSIVVQSHHEKLKLHSFPWSHTANS